MANICAFGWKAGDFTLKGVDGKYALADVRGQRQSNWCAEHRASRPHRVYR